MESVIASFNVGMRFPVLEGRRSVGCSSSSVCAVWGRRVMMGNEDNVCC